MEVNLKGKIRLRKMYAAELPNWFDLSTLSGKGMIANEKVYWLFFGDKPSSVFIIKTGLDRECRWGVVNYNLEKQGKEYWIAFFPSFTEARRWLFSELRMKLEGGCKMTKSELVTALAKKAGVRKKDAEACLNAFISVVTETLKEGGKVEIRGFGTFFMKERSPRTARNLRTGKKIKVPAKLVPTFKPGKELKKATEKEIK